MTWAMAALGLAGIMFAQNAPRRPGSMAAREFFRLIDANSDHRISAMEWSAFCKPADFKAADTDKDGHVVPRELHHFMQPGQGAPIRGMGPVVGTPAPKVSAKHRDTGKLINLSKVSRPTVLIFGSYT
ncbi:MAG: hypothetical protein CMO74_03680 [Verrucomicrobiales bacterium]|nr:hypothetical protein [Verrucomicrobiales bacterium]|tara:strand:+ start:401 stop:784 length:384 start_codon:yes stop_codon:yes gene_type:complete